MAFFEDLSKKITDTVDVVGKKTGEAVEIQKLRSQISNLERNMDKNYNILGKMLYDGYQDGMELTDEAKALCEEITGSAVLIREYESEIAEIRGLRKCPNCDAAVGEDVNFCPRCGKKLNDFDED